MHKGIFILRGDDKEHNGDCNPIYSVYDLIEQNNLTEVYDTYEIKYRNKYDKSCLRVSDYMKQPSNR